MTSLISSGEECRKREEGRAEHLLCVAGSVTAGTRACLGLDRVRHGVTLSPRTTVCAPGPSSAGHACRAQEFGPRRKLICSTSLGLCF